MNNLELRNDSVQFGIVTLSAILNNLKFTNLKFTRVDMHG